MEKMSKSHEDYLEAIVMLGGTTEVSVRSVDIANKMGVSKASVNKAVTALKEKALAEQPYYGDITLTEAGFAYGTAIPPTLPRAKPALWNTPSATTRSRNGELILKSSTSKGAKAPIAEAKPHASRPFPSWRRAVFRLGCRPRGVARCAILPNASCIKSHT